MKNGIVYTNEKAILTHDNLWEVTVSAEEAKSIDTDVVIQTAGYAFWVTGKTKLEDGRYLLNLRPKS
jgi:hypothetical protein